MILPSEELLSKVTGHELDNIQISNTTLTYHRLNSTTFYLSIYELLHLMKKYIIDKGYAYSVGINRDNEFYITLSEVPQSEAFGMARLFTDIADSEYEAVTKACEWVREQQ